MAMNTTNESMDDMVSPDWDSVFQSLMMDPVLFFKALMQDIVQGELQKLKQDFELQMLLQKARYKYPEIETMETLLVEEMIRVLESMPEGTSYSWEDVLDNAVEGLRQKFTSMMSVKSMPTLSKEVPYMESAQMRQTEPQPNPFSRKDIANMSLKEYIKHEKHIEDALKNQQIY